jgi:peptide/nickel transport system ATP-binding protein
MTADGASILEATDLEIEYATRAVPVRALDAATLTVRRGEMTGVVGESGSGKTTLGMAAGRMLAANARPVGGDLRIAGEPVLSCDDTTLRGLRRDVLGFVFQNPVAALDPTKRVARQMHLAGGDDDHLQSASDALHDMGLRDVPRVLRSYPHELSGGMAQRVGIAMALRRRPKLLIADEPTAAVDATLRPQILELLVSRCRAEGAALVLLTHDLHAVATHCTRIAVMYGGRVVEDGPTADVLAAPKHPYTRALLAALPGEERPGQRLAGIAGAPPVLRGPAEGCAFALRCAEARPMHFRVRPEYEIVDGRGICCHLYRDERAGRPAVVESRGDVDR